MRNLLLILEAFQNSTPQNAVDKIEQGYRHGVSLSPSCYAVVGAMLAKMKPEDATIRLWGLRPNTIAHADAILPNKQVISDIPAERFIDAGCLMFERVVLIDVRVGLHVKPANTSTL